MLHYADSGDEALVLLIGHLGMPFPEGHGRADDEVEEDDENDGIEPGFTFFRVPAADNERSSAPSAGHLLTQVRQPKHSADFTASWDSTSISAGQCPVHARQWVHCAPSRLIFTGLSRLRSPRSPP